MTCLSHVSFSYGSQTILKDFTYEFHPGECYTLMGASGIGKTTLIRLLAGLEKPDSGSICIDTPVSVKFQEPRLCPWLTTAGNIELVTHKGSPLVGRWLQAVRLEDRAEHYPDELSGGMQQRAALARALAYMEYADCPLVLLDEPFNGLDADLHDEMRCLVLDAVKGRTLILVSHDPSDACGQLIHL